MAGIEQGDHQQRTIATAGETRAQILHQRVKFRQMALRRLLPANQLGHLVERLLRHLQRSFTVAEGESPPRGNARQLLWRRPISGRPDDKRRFHLRQQLKIRLRTQPDINHRGGQRRFIHPQVIVRDIGHAVGRHAKRQQEFCRQPLQRHNTLRIEACGLGAAHLPQQGRQGHRRQQTATGNERGLFHQ